MSEEELQLLPLEPPSTRCPNCNAEVRGQFCPSCGQNQKVPDRFFLTILSEAFEDVFRIDSRAARTLFNLIFRPGFLTLQYFAGRRARYVQPLRLYLITSLLFFFFLSFQNALTTETVIKVNVDEANGGNTAQWQTDISAYLDKFNVKFLTPEQNEALVKVMRTQADKAILGYGENRGQFIRQFASEVLELAPQIMFFLLPLFAVAMKLFYLWSGHYYTEHLILAVHNHCFLFTAMLLSKACEFFSHSAIAIVTEPLDVIITIWVPVYMYWSLRVFYLQGYFFTAIKFLLLTLSYLFLFILGLFFALSWSVMTL